jgi:hypothetical protein
MAKRKTDWECWEKERDSMVKLFKDGKTMREVSILYGTEPWIVENVVREFMRRSKAAED